MSVRSCDASTERVGMVLLKLVRIFPLSINHSAVKVTCFSKSRNDELTLFASLFHNSSLRSFAAAPTRSTLQRSTPSRLPSLVISDQPFFLTKLLTALLLPRLPRLLPLPLLQPLMITRITITTTPPRRRLPRLLRQSNLVTRTPTEKLVSQSLLFVPFRISSLTHFMIDSLLPSLDTRKFQEASRRFLGITLASRIKTFLTCG